MIPHFDLHSRLSRLAVLHRHRQRMQSEIKIYDSQNEQIGEVDYNYLPNFPRWSPDGSRLSFISTDGSLCVYDLDSHVVNVLLKRKSHRPAFAHWSPDGARLAFSDSGILPTGLPRVNIIDVLSKDVTQLADDGDTLDLTPIWSTSGQWIAFQRRHIGDESNQYNKILIYDFESMSYQPYGKPNCSLQRFGWRPGSTEILLLVGSANSRALEIVDVTTMEVNWRFDGADGITGAAFSPDGKRVLCVCDSELLWIDYSSLAVLERLSLETKGLSRIQSYSPGPQLAFDKHDQLYFLTAKSSIHRWNIGDECQMVLKENVQWKEPHYTHNEYQVISRDGIHVPVQRFIPRDAKLPAVMYVHGGPGAEIDLTNPFMASILEGGYEVICVAYRGSSGYGNEYRRANLGEYGRADVWDLIACGIDWRTRIGKGRPLVLFGLNYGGFLSLLAMTDKQSPWSGGIVVSSLSGLHRFSHHLNRAVPTDPIQRQIALRERSPLEQAYRIQVPVLMFHGEDDIVATTEELMHIQNQIRSAGGQCLVRVFKNDTRDLPRHYDQVVSETFQFLEKLD